MIVERYSFAVPFELVKIRDADTVTGVAMIPVRTVVPILGLVSEGQAPMKVAVRLEGVAAPENSTPEGKEATLWARAWFAFRAQKQLWLHTDGKLDNFGRWLGDIREAQDHVSGLSLDLLESPHGEPFARHLHGSW